MARATTKMRKKNINGHTVKYMPQRTCVACRRTEGKRDLVRLVRTAAGIVEIDTSGKKSGRGAYLCRAVECWETGIKGGKLEHSLKTTLTQNDRNELIRAGQELMKESIGG